MLTLISLPSTLTLLDVPFLRMDRHGELLEASEAAQRLLADRCHDAHAQIRTQLPSVFDEWRRSPSSPRTWHADILLDTVRLEARLTVIVPNTGRPEALTVFVPNVPALRSSGSTTDARPQGLEEMFVRYRLTPRECDVALRLLAGKTTTVIAAEVGISVHTARRHTEQLYKKLGVQSRAALVRRLLPSP